MLSGFSPAALISGLLARWWLFIVVPLAAGIVAAGIVMLVPSRYTADMAIVPETRGAGVTSQLAGLAALAGVDVASSSSPSRSPQFYVGVLSSRPVLYAVLERRFSTEGLDDDFAARDSVTLLEVLPTKGRTHAESLWASQKSLTDITQVSLNPRTGVIRVTVTHRSAQLAAAVANTYAQELNRFNREVRQSSARQRRRFVEEQVRTAASSLASAEEAVSRFLAGNRQYEDSPSLRFEHQRLQRALQVQQDLYLELRRQLDAARIAEVDDIPALSTIEPAIPPERRSWPRRRLWVLGAMVLAGAATLALVTYFILRNQLPWLDWRRRAAPAG